MIIVLDRQNDKKTDQEVNVSFGAVSPKRFSETSILEQHYIKIVVRPGHRII